MITKPVAAFGYLCYVCNVVAGETKEVEIDTDGVYNSGYYYHTKGLASPTVVETGEKLENRTAGWLNLEKPNMGASGGRKLIVTYLKDTEWLCISNQANPNGLPKVSSVIIKKGKKLTITKDTDLFIVNGSLDVNGKLFVGPTQLRVRTGDVTVTAKENTYSLRFE